MRHTNSLLNASDAKCQELASREVNTVSEITASISRMPAPGKSFPKTFGKNYYLQAGNTFKLAQLNRKET